MAHPSEAHQGFVMSDGTVLISPTSLLDWFEKATEPQDEFLDRLMDGDVENWLRQTGWEELAQQVAAIAALPRSKMLPRLHSVLMRAVNPSSSCRAPRSPVDTPIPNTSFIDYQVFMDHHSTSCRTFAQAEFAFADTRKRISNEMQSAESTLQEAATSHDDSMRQVLQTISSMLEEMKTGMFKIGERPSSHESATILGIGLDQACLIATNEMNQWRALVASLRQAEQSQAFLRAAAAMASLVAAWVILSYLIPGAILLLLSPVLLGLSVWAWKVDFAVTWTARIGNTAEAGKSSPRQWVRLLSMGLSGIWRVTANLEDRYWRAGARAIAALYAMVPMLALLLMVGYALMLLVALVAVIILVLFVIAKSTD